MEPTIGLGRQFEEWNHHGLKELSLTRAVEAVLIQQNLGRHAGLNAELLKSLGR